MLNLMMLFLVISNVIVLANPVSQNPETDTDAEPLLSEQPFNIEDSTSSKNPNQCTSETSTNILSDDESVNDNSNINLIRSLDACPQIQYVAPAPPVAPHLNLPPQPSLQEQFTRTTRPKPNDPYNRCASYKNRPMQVDCRGPEVGNRDTDSIDVVMNCAFGKKPARAPASGSNRHVGEYCCKRFEPWPPAWTGKDCEVLEPGVHIDRISESEYRNFLKKWGIQLP